MSNIILPSRRIWTRQPQTPVGIDWSNPITRGLAFCQFGNFPDSVSPYPQYSLSGAFSLSVRAAGRNFLAPSTQIAGYVNFAKTISIAASQNYAFLVLAKPSTDAASGAGSTHYITGSNVNSLSIGSASIIAQIDNNTATLAHSYSVPTLFLAQRVGNKNYVYSPSGSVNATTGTRAQAITAIGIGRATGNNLSNTETYMVAFFSRDLAVSEYNSLVSNPWQLLRPQVRRTIIDFGASGTTSVTSDSSPSYLVRNAINADLAAIFNVRGNAASDSANSYTVRTNATRDATASYSLRGLVQSDDAEAYKVRGLVQASDAEAYNIRGAVTADKTALYDIQSSTSVANSNAVSYSVRGAVTGDSSPSYAVRSQAQADSTISYSVRTSAYRDVVASYAIEAAESAVYADLTTNYSIDGVAPACPSAESIAAAVLAALKADPSTLTVPKFLGLK